MGKIVVKKMKKVVKTKEISAKTVSTDSIQIRGIRTAKKKKRKKTKMKRRRKKKKRIFTKKSQKRKISEKNR